MPSAWDRRRVAAVALGGATGAGLRWAVLTTITVASGLPWPLLALNVTGSFLLGVLLAAEWDHPSARVLLHDAGAIGLCGGLTTFSTFSVEIVDLVRREEVGLAVGYGALSVALSITAVVAGAAAMRRRAAVALPVEEQP